MYQSLHSHFQSRKTSKPPVSNTGVNLTEKNQISLVEPDAGIVRNQQCGIDWLRGTMPIKNFRELMNLVQKYFKEECSLQVDKDGTPIKSRFYRQNYRSVLGIFIGFSNTAIAAESTRQHCYLDLPAGALSYLTYPQLEKFMYDLGQINFKSSRLDLKIDDYDKYMTPKKAYEAVRSGNVSGFRSYRWLSSGAINDESADTLELGRRGKSGAGKMVRIYDKSKQTGGEFDCIRFELELSGEKSKDAFDALASTPLDMWSQIIVGFVASAVKFIDRSVSSRADRCPLLLWWHNIVADVTPMPFSPRIIVKSFDKAKKWFEKQVLPTMAMILEGIHASEGIPGTDSLFLEWWCIGEDRMTDEHRSLLESWYQKIGFRGEPRMGYDLHTPIYRRMKHMSESFIPAF